MRDGFSEEPGNLRVGHFLGLRWFQLRVAIERVAIPKLLDIGRVYEPWEPSWEIERREVPLLHGAYGLWEPGENVAACANGLPHTPPAPHCGCGFWAYWALGEKRVDDPAVAAIVKGYGDYIKGERGFRVSHAKIEALFIPGSTGTDTTANALEARYGVPVYGHMAVMLACHPAPPGQPPLSDDYYCHRGEALRLSCPRCGGTSWNVMPGAAECTFCAARP